MTDANNKPKLTFLERILEKFRGVFFDNPEEAENQNTSSSKQWRRVDWQTDEPAATTPSSPSSASMNQYGSRPYAENVSNQPSGASAYPFGYASPDGSGNNPVEVWKRFEPVEFDDRMKEIGNQMQKTLEKRLLEVGEEMERRMGRRMLEVEEDVDRRVSRRIVDSEESMDKRLSKKISELENEVSALFDKKIQKANEDIEARVKRRKQSPLSRRVVIAHNPQTSSRISGSNGKNMLPAVYESHASESLSKIMHQLELLNRLKIQSMITPEAYEKEKARIDAMLEQLNAG